MFVFSTKDTIMHNLTVTAQLSPHLALQSMWYVLLLLLVGGISGFVYLIGNESHLGSE